jgi:hypothetical protein
MAPAKKSDVLTSSQKKALRQAGRSLERAYREARRNLAAAGVTRRNSEGSFRCLLPPAGHCREFQRPAEGGLRCKRCGHSFFRHDVF